MIRILHVSDLHFGKSQKQTGRALRLLEKIKPLVRDVTPTFVLVTGDIIDNSNLGKNSWKDQFEIAKAALAPFKPNLLAVPGNHEYGFGGFGYSQPCSDFLDGIFMPAIGVTHEFRTKQPFLKVLDDGAGTKVLTIGLNSCLMTSSPLDIAKGEIGDVQLKALEAILKNPADRTIPKIVYLHHIPHRRAKGIGMSLTDYEKLMDVASHRIQAFAFGHEGSMKDPASRKAKTRPLPPRDMRIRGGRRHGIKYYLDANMSVENRACYCLEADKDSFTAKLISFA